MMKLDIIIPVKNEAKNIPLLVSRLDKVLSRIEIDYRLIFVDDRSTDATVATLKVLSQTYPITFLTKKGRLGKAYSILEGAKIATSEYIVMIDADLQYPPEIIPEMLKKLTDYEVVLANRKIYKSTLFRRLASRFNAFIFGRLLLGLPFDIQTGLKVFKRDILSHLDTRQVTAWSLDIPLLATARNLGYRIGAVNITFEHRHQGGSHLQFFQAAGEIAASAFKVKLSRERIYYLSPQSEQTMMGAGVVHRRKRFITHTTLTHHESALETVTFGQRVGIMFIAGLIAGGLWVDIRLTILATLAFLSFIYFVDSLFSLYVTIRSLQIPPEIGVEDFEISQLKETQLPLYSILCPLYREAHVLPQFLKAIAQLDWPKNKLDVVLLFEEDDRETIAKAQTLNLPVYVRIVVVPHSEPKTKPKACNFGLSVARGDYVVVYDAEDIPDTLQLKKAYIAFEKSDARVFCLQAKLNYYNPHQNLLTRLFTAEYSLWFDVILPGLQSIQATIPLGGTSNHFRTASLRRLKAWDPFNVAEDCDLGVRLFKAGYKTAIIDSVTLEEANSDLKNWFRQRIRWLKGYTQTYLVHSRNPLKQVRDFGVHALILQLIIGMRIIFMLINPLLWAATFSYFALYSWVGPAIESVYPTAVFYMASVALVFGNFLYLYSYMVGCAKRGHWSLIKYVCLVPLYWFMVSLAAVGALVQLMINPHYWEKTHHGLHFRKSNSKLPFVTVRPAILPAWFKLPQLTKEKAGGVFWILAGVAVIFCNFLYNTYLGRSLTVSEFGTLSLLSGFFYLLQIVFIALSRSVTHRSAYLQGRYKAVFISFWEHVRGNVFKIALIVSCTWLLLLPVIHTTFKSELMPFLFFTPVILFGFIGAVNSGFLSGNRSFLFLGGVIIFEAITKLGLAVILNSMLGTPGVYLALPISMGFTVVLSWYLISRMTDTAELERRVIRSFPRRFFVTSLFFQFATIAFLSFDVIFAKYFLGKEAAGSYALMALVGKMIFYGGGVFSQFINPLVSRAQGDGKGSERIFQKLFLLVMGTSVSIYAALLVWGEPVLRLLFDEKINTFVHLLPMYGLAIVLFTIASSITLYHQLKKEWSFPLLAFFLSGIQIGGLWLFHRTLEDFTGVMLATSFVYIVTLLLAHLFSQALTDVINNSIDFLGLFSPVRAASPNFKNLRILIFNWRDTRHAWAGGAEVYIHELARRWVQSGHHVTVFCGNDGKSLRNQVVDGVHIVRRGGLYVVYLWAFLYYMVRFRGRFDVVIDCENGIPFFTPLYVRVSKFLLIHHIHQDVFRDHLPFPLSEVGRFLESRLMPFVYRQVKTITVSESSKKEIEQLSVSSDKEITVINPGISMEDFSKVTKTASPSFLYLGRLKPYKNVDVALYAFKEVLKKFPTACLTIAGSGESEKDLKQLVDKLNINAAVSFKGRVNDTEKAKLYATHWVLLQPSSIEGWGITVIEANAWRTPVVASDVGGLRDSIIDGKTGILVTPRDASQLSQAMLRLASDAKLRAFLSREAYNWSKHFSWDESAREFYRTITDSIRTDYLSRLPAVVVPMAQRAKKTAYSYEY